MAHNRATEQAKALGLERMEQARRILLADRDSTWFDTACSASGGGQLMDRNWYARCRVAMWHDGILLADDGNWASFLREINHWPSMLWAALLVATELRRTVEGIYPSDQANNLAMTIRTAQGVTISKADWVPKNLTRHSQLKILSWCGVVGGSLPSVQAFQ